MAEHALDFVMAERAQPIRAVTHEDILDRIVRLETKVDALTEAFAAGRGAVRMLFVLGGLVTALAAIAASVKALVH
jgi:hypothetical protein